MVFDNEILMVHHHVSHEHDVSGKASPWGNTWMLDPCLRAEKVTPKMISQAPEGTG
jgi:hypothetical protein